MTEPGHASSSSRKGPLVKTISLDGTWTLYTFPAQASPVAEPADLAAYQETALQAEVPGNVELDLVAAGQLPDPFYGDHIALLQPYELHEWWYQRTFETPEATAGQTRSAGRTGSARQRIELVFHGADCIATDSPSWLSGMVSPTKTSFGRGP